MKRGMIRWTFVAAVVGAVLTVAGLPADDKKPADERKPDAKADAIDKIGTAYNLAKIGREMKSAESLIVAAKIIGSTPLNDKAKSETKPAPENEKAPADFKPDDLTVEGLLAEAAKMSDKPYIGEFIKDTRKELSERTRGEIDGPATHNGYVGANGTSTWTAVFVSGSRAVITIASMCGTPLDVTVYDGIGGTASRYGQSNSTISWFPRETKTYTVKIRNSTNHGVSFRFINN